MTANWTQTRTTQHFILFFTIFPIFSHGINHGKHTVAGLDWLKLDEAVRAAETPALRGVKRSGAPSTAGDDLLPHGSKRKNTGEKTPLSPSRINLPVCYFSFSEHQWMTIVQ